MTPKALVAYDSAFLRKVRALKEGRERQKLSPELARIERRLLASEEAILHARQIIVDLQRELHNLRREKGAT